MHVYLVLKRTKDKPHSTVQCYRTQKSKWDGLPQVCYFGIEDKPRNRGCYQLFRFQNPIKEGNWVPRSVLKWANGCSTGTGTLGCGIITHQRIRWDLCEVWGIGMLIHRTTEKSTDQRRFPLRSSCLRADNGGCLCSLSTQ